MKALIYGIFVALTLGSAYLAFLSPNPDAAFLGKAAVVIFAGCGLATAVATRGDARS